LQPSFAVLPLGARLNSMNGETEYQPKGVGMSTNRYPVTIVATKEEALSQLAGVEPTPLNARAAATLGLDQRVVVTATDMASPPATDFVVALRAEQDRQVRVAFLDTARDPGERDRGPADEAVAAAIRLGCPIGRAVLSADASAEIDLGSRQLRVELVEPSLGARIRALPGAHVGQPLPWAGPHPPYPTPRAWTIALLSRGNAVRASVPVLSKEQLRSSIDRYARTTDLVPVVHITSALDDLLWRAHCRCAPDAPVFWVPGELEGVRRVWGIGYGGEHAPLATLARKPRSTIRVGLAFVPASVVDGLERAAGLLDGTRLVRLEGTTFRSDCELNHRYELKDPPAFISPTGLLDRDRRNKRRKLLPYDHGSGSRHADGVLQLALGAERTGNQIERLVNDGHAEELGWPRLDGVAALDPVELP
jgi:hypothetical protein